MDPAQFRPTWKQAFARGTLLGVLGSVLGVSVGLVAAVSTAPPGWVWSLLAFGPLLGVAPAGVLLRLRLGTAVVAGGIRTVTPSGEGVEPWSRVVDLRAERRGARTVVSVYLESGASVQLRAPYSGELFAADPRFEQKVFALSQLWRCHRFGGVPS